MSKFPVIFAREFTETVRSKAFKTISVLLIIILLIAGVAVTFMSLDSSNDTAAEPVGAEETGELPLAVADMTGNGTGEKLCAMLNAKSIEPATSEEYSKMVEDEQYSAVAALSLFDDGNVHVRIYEKAQLNSTGVSQSVHDALSQIERIDKLTKLGITEQDAESILVGSGVTVENMLVGNFAIGNYLISYGMMIIMFLCITLYGSLVSTNVATEKSSRAMEVLITCASPRDLLFGKVLGTGAAAMLQMGLFIGCAGGLAGVAASFSPAVRMILDEVLGIGALQAVYMLLYFILGFLLITFIYGALGSLVSRLEDISSLTSMPTMVFMIGYFIAIFVFASGESGTLGTVCSFIPFWSPMVMIVRMSIEDVPNIQIIVSLLIQALSCVLAAWLAVKLYRRGTTMYGKAPKLGDVIRMLKSN